MVDHESDDYEDSLVASIKSNVDQYINTRQSETQSFLEQMELRKSEKVPATPELRGKSAELASISHKPRYLQIWLFLVVTTMFSVNQNYVLSYINQMKSLLSAKLGWAQDSQQQIWLYQTLSGVYNIGACCGALSCSVILNIGRRKTLLLTGCVYLVAAVMTQFMDFYMLCISRLISGFGCGLTLVATSRIIEEYVPLAMYSTASPFNIFMAQMGSFLAIMSAVALPKEDYADPLSPSQVQTFEDSTSWRIIFGLSFVWVGIGMLGFILLIRWDTPKFYVSKQDDEGAVLAINKIYVTSGSKIQANKIKRFIEKSCNNQVNKISLWDSFSDEKYQRATLVNVTVMSFHAMTGYAAVMGFSSTIFAAGDTGESSGLTPRQGSYMVGLFNVVAAMAGIYTIRTFGRRQILLVGHMLITVMHFLIALAAYMAWTNTEIALVCAYICIYMTTSGPGAWAFAAETCTDSALAACVFTLYFWQTVESFTTEVLMEWSNWGTFLIFGGITAVSVVFIYFFVGETKGLSEKEKKEIFMPGATWGRVLKDGEQPYSELGQDHFSRRTVNSQQLTGSDLGHDSQQLKTSADFVNPRHSGVQGESEIYNSVLSQNGPTANQ